MTKTSTIRERGAELSFWKSCEGQDLVEYSLLMAFVCLAGAAFYIGIGNTTSSLWSIVNSRMAAANQTS